MKTISIRELHAHTGRWIREAATSREPLVVLDRGRPTARLVAYREDCGISFSDRKEVEGFAQLPVIPVDSGTIFEEDRR